jgi:hypothetical protein
MTQGIGSDFKPQYCKKKKKRGLNEKKDLSLDHSANPSYIFIYLFIYLGV